MALMISTMYTCANWPEATIAEIPIFRYTILMTSRSLRIRLTVAACTVLTAVPLGAAAYFSPEEVLLNKALFLPPTSRETQDRVARQAETSAERRNAAFDESYQEQHAAAPEENVFLEPDNSGTTSSNAQPADSSLSAADLELLRTLRLLSRVEDRQRVLQYGNFNRLHSGAPLDDGKGTGKPLTPTGAGAWLSAITMVGAVGWTLRRARKGTAFTV